MGLKITSPVEPQERAAAKYREGLSGLGAQKGQRNARLLGLASLGIMAGLTDERILAEVREASGTPPLTDGEIRHALRTARRDTAPLAEGGGTAQTWAPPPKPKPPLGSGARDYVRRMIVKGEGATAATLAACSPLAVPSDPREQTAAFLFWMYDDAELVFGGEQTDRGETGKNIRPAAAWLATDGQCAPPPLIIANPLTGREGVTKEGKPSYRCGACVASHRFALIEFDAMPLKEQAAFWAGVIGTRTLPLRSLVFSGGKSVHGLIEIGAADAEEWARKIDTLLFAVANPEAAPEHRADRACRNPDRLTRLAGARRPDKGTRQALLWLSPEALRRSPAIEAKPTRATTTPECSEAASAESDAAGGVCGAARCRDCWNWTPEGFKHGCAAGVRQRFSPDWRGACPHFDEVREVGARCG